MKKKFQFLKSGPQCIAHHKVVQDYLYSNNCRIESQIFNRRCMVMNFVQYILNSFGTNPSLLFINFTHDNCRYYSVLALLLCPLPPILFFANRSQLFTTTNISLFAASCVKLFRRVASEKDDIIIFTTLHYYIDYIICVLFWSISQF